MTKLNFEDFSKLIVGLDIIIWPFYYERTPREITKMLNFFEFSRLFMIFLVFKRLFFVQ